MPAALDHDALMNTDLWLAIGSYITLLLGIGGIWALLRHLVAREVADQVTATSQAKIEAVVSAAAGPLRRELYGPTGAASLRDEVAAIRTDAAVARATTEANAVAIAGVSARLADLRDEFVRYLENGGPRRGGGQPG